MPTTIWIDLNNSYVDICVHGKLIFKKTICFDEFQGAIVVLGNWKFVLK